MTRNQLRKRIKAVTGPPDNSLDTREQIMRDFIVYIADLDPCERERFNAALIVMALEIKMGLLESIPPVETQVVR